MASFKEFFANISFWVGLSLGLLTILDFLLRENHKKWLSSKAETLWIWLDDQRAGKLITVLLKEKTQNFLVLLAHLMIITIIAAFILRLYFGVNIDADVQIGQPRIYAEQVWVDISAMLLSLVLATKYIHPRFIKWLSFEPTVKSYLLKTLYGFTVCLLAILLIFFIELPIINPAMELDTLTEIEAYFGGVVVIIILHAITALIAAPIMSETFVFMGLLFGGIYWTILIFLLMIIFRILQFVLIRIAEHPKGPVIAISGLLTGIGAVLKVFLT